jgi:hypothetical protein
MREVTMMTETKKLSWMSAMLLVSVAANLFHIRETLSKSDLINVKCSDRRLSGGERQRHTLGIKGNNTGDM